MTIDQTAREIAEISDNLRKAYRANDDPRFERAIDRLNQLPEILRRHESPLRAECERLVREWRERAAAIVVDCASAQWQRSQLEACATALAAALAKEVSK